MNTKKELDARDEYFNAEETYLLVCEAECNDSNDYLYRSTVGSSKFELRGLLKSYGDIRYQQGIKDAEQSIELPANLHKAAYEYAVKHSNAPDKETPDWIICDFKAGAEWAMKKLEQSKWIPVEERLPGKFDKIKVKVCRTPNGFVIAQYSMNQWYVDGETGNRSLFYEITHWQELSAPDLPEQGKEKNV